MRHILRLQQVDGEVGKSDSDNRAVYCAAMLKTKSYWSPIDKKGDGLRILASRFRARGSGTTRYDVWMPSLAPSERILKARHAEKTESY